MSDSLTLQECGVLRALFLSELPVGLAEAERAHALLVADPENRAAWDSLRHFFHRVSGSAASAGFPMLGRVCSLCETFCELVGRGALPRRDVQPGALFREALGAVVEVLHEAGGAERLAPHVADPGAECAAPGSEKVLVVDDDPVSAAYTVQTLRRAGFDATHIAEAARAIEAIFIERPDLLILDVVMPGAFAGAANAGAANAGAANAGAPGGAASGAPGGAAGSSDGSFDGSEAGFELCRRIRSHPALAVIPVIFLTRLGDVEQRVKGLEAGGNDYIAKPFAAPELVARVRSHLTCLASLREMAIRDGLTRCYNQKYFKSRLDQELARARRYKTELAVALLDIDFFKRVNDVHGHPAGDAVLSQLSNVISASVRSTDVVSRYGGEEFGVLLVEAGAPEAQVILGRMRQRIEAQRFAIGAAPDGTLVEGAPTLSITVSIGLAAARETDTAQTLLLRSDGALYAAKGKGRNRVELAG